jgi:hypothetical protein
LWLTGSIFVKADGMSPDSTRQSDAQAAAQQRCVAVFLRSPKKLNHLSTSNQP